MNSLRIATWNLMRPDVRMISDRVDLATKILQLQNADVICLQESWPEARAQMSSKLKMHLFVLNDNSGCAILSRFPIISSQEISMPHVGTQGNPVMASIRSSSGRIYNVISAHLAWGGHAEGHRRLQAISIDQAASAAQEKNFGSVTVLAGDLNCTPLSSTIRYLSGLEPLSDNTSTLWVDSWSYCRDATANGFTVKPVNYLAASTAMQVGIIDPLQIPDRRIDYIFVKDWIYGRPGSPIKSDIFGSEFSPEFASDHGGVVISLWDPPQI